ncbi:hypothetical protein NDA18_002575 [Ustilago nuda]|nr:hypothetical protein NDA18_002575 [Ustilago nuda]
MRLTAAALTGCVAAGLACLFHPASANQVPFSPQSSSPHQNATASYHGTGSWRSKKWTLPLASNNSAIVFDKYSLALAGGQQRLFILAAEFHPWRLPVPSLWRDVIQKIKAAGFNTASIYTHWGLIQPTPILLRSISPASTTWTSSLRWRKKKVSSSSFDQAHTSMQRPPWAVWPLGQSTSMLYSEPTTQLGKTHGSLTSMPSLKS